MSSLPAFSSHSLVTFHCFSATCMDLYDSDEVVVCTSAVVHVKLQKLSLDYSPVDSKFGGLSLLCNKFLFIYLTAW